MAFWHWAHPDMCFFLIFWALIMDFGMFAWNDRSSVYGIANTNRRSSFVLSFHCTMKYTSRNGYITDHTRLALILSTLIFIKMNFSFSLTRETHILTDRAPPDAACDVPVLSLPSAVPLHAGIMALCEHYVLSLFSLSVRVAQYARD